MSSAPKTARFEMRLTEADARLLEERALACGLTKSAYVLSQIRARPHLLAPDRDALRAVRLELARQGNNLNQIAYRLNALGRHDPRFARLAADEIEASQRARIEAYRAAQRALAIERI